MPIAEPTKKQPPPRKKKPPARKKRPIPGGVKEKRMEGRDRVREAMMKERRKVDRKIRKFDPGQPPKGYRWSRVHDAYRLFRLPGEPLLQEPDYPQGPLPADPYSFPVPPWPKGPLVNPREWTPGDEYGDSQDDWPLLASLLETLIRSRARSV